MTSMVSLRSPSKDTVRVIQLLPISTMNLSFSCQMDVVTSNFTIQICIRACGFGRSILNKKRDDSLGMLPRSSTQLEELLLSVCAWLATSYLPPSGRRRRRAWCLFPTTSTHNKVCAQPHVALGPRDAHLFVFVSLSLFPLSILALLLVFRAKGASKPLTTYAEPARDQRLHHSHITIRGGASILRVVGVSGQELSSISMNMCRYSLTKFRAPKTGHMYGLRAEQLPGMGQRTFDAFV